MPGSVSKLSDQAYSYAVQFGIPGNGINDAKDAFRHAYASAIISRDYGPGIAENLGTGWEILGALHGQPDIEARMDMYNNYVGRMIQMQLGPDATNDQIAYAIKEAFDAGMLITTPGGTVNPWTPINQIDNKDWSPPDWSHPFTIDNYGNIIYLPFCPRTDIVISFTLGQNPDPLVKTIHYVRADPLILDLDGDGLEITPLSKGILFDADGDGDGIKNATAWADADDGMLVWDRNGNGVIDSGQEMFGDQTIKSDGTLAKNGFDALYSWTVRKNKWKPERYLT